LSGSGGAAELVAAIVVARTAVPGSVKVLEDAVADEVSTPSGAAADGDVSSKAADAADPDPSGPGTVRTKSRYAATLLARIGT
jgi:hypothetical protein